MTRPGMASARLERPPLGTCRVEELALSPAAGRHLAFDAGALLQANVGTIENVR